MTYPTLCRSLTAALAFAALAGSAAADDQAITSACKPVHADLVEARATTGCKPGHSFCFLGEVDGNHGLRGTTYFRGDSAGTAPPASPSFLPYSGVFEYTTAGGVLVMRETGLTNQSQGTPESGAITAYQQIVSATGEYAGATGYFFVSGFNRDGRIVTRVTGEICTP
jgi:hypothetical protein